MFNQKLAVLNAYEPETFVFVYWSHEEGRSKIDGNGMVESDFRDFRNELGANVEGIDAEMAAARRLRYDPITGDLFTV